MTQQKAEFQTLRGLEHTQGQGEWLELCQGV